MKGLFRIFGLVALVIVAGLSIGLGMSWGPEFSSQILTKLSSPASATEASGEESDSNEPLYWVAPMDPNYRRDQPGKSPMGMDLVPVFKQSGEALPAGTVEISPAVINNLGVRTAKVEHAILADAIETVGYVGFDERQLQEVHARVAGWLRRLHVRSDGDPIEKFGRLYDIYSPELISAQEEYLIALDSGDTVLIDASQDKLANLGVSSGTIDRIRQNRTVIQQIRVYAPQAGVVDSLSVGQGAYVTPGQRLLRIASMDPVWIEGEVFESQLAKLRVGAAVEIQTDAVPGRRWQGQVDYIYPVLNSVTRTAKLRIVLENPDGALLPNMFTRLSIAADAPEPALLVAREALIRTGTMERVVLATGEGHFKSVAVTIGRRSRGQVQILEGLEEGDEVVISAQFLIDSESSIASDFMRMSELDESLSGNRSGPEKTSEAVWAIGVLEAINEKEGIASISHEPIPEWEWPAMSMKFSLDDAVDIEPLKDGDSIRFRVFETDAGDYQINAIEAADTGEAFQ
ncbi:efflux RND transporter periplasmic adaptor subunit [Granulosicoccus antarcticus]|uniref:Cation efflux system protein CusB n=1 Tax=Granulosicoccus antarcticus IMCC3135 TaxID=1192854 RepID=A0A2Z2NZV6_9GAMM|nr:efflux RND transporter periplasmic adaptor subunit [Granulosicoccus antarcticus]ASJ73367.1 Cation efflux system protein CusB [Granulosicoccus antarcticus IMCC3135]